jgi:hypothetical protein
MRSHARRFPSRYVDACGSYDQGPIVAALRRRAHSPPLRIGDALAARMLSYVVIYGALGVAYVALAYSVMRYR